MPRYVSGCAVHNACRVHLKDTGEKELEAKQVRNGLQVMAIVT